MLTTFAPLYLGSMVNFGESIRTVQDLGVFAGLPELVRTGDTYDARFTLRNGTDKAMEVIATPTLSPAVATEAPSSASI